MKEATGRIRIIQIPEGEAPLWVRKAWVGLTLPCDPICGYPSQCGHLDEAIAGANKERGVLTKQPLKQNRYGFSVPQAPALIVLKKKSIRAARWWQLKGFPQHDQYFHFDQSEAEIISGVTLQTVVLCDEMETGRAEPPGR